MLVILLPWTGAQTSTQKPYFNRIQYLCKDDRVSDETMALLKVEDKKCQDNYDKEIKKIEEDYDECLKESDYSNDKVKDQATKYELVQKCSAKYMECRDDKIENGTNFDFQDNNLGQLYRNADITLMVCLNLILCVFFKFELNLFRIVKKRRLK